jgi:glutathione peroxidase
MKSIFLSFAAATLILTAACTKPDTKLVPPTQPPVVTYTAKEIYHYGFTTLQGKAVKLSDYKGKKLMIVNTASFCGNTPQYEKLEALYAKYMDKLVIVGFPCNQFGQQEPGSNNDIETFCSGTYHVTFPMSQKIDVKGAKQDSIYRWLTLKEMNGKLDSEVAWNFQKYLIDEKGNFVAMFDNAMQPDDPSITAAIEK